MPQNLYYVQPGDTLSGIADRFGVSVQDILAANVICNPNLIFVNQVLVIPSQGLKLPKAGGGPYYVVLPGDTLYCLAQQFNTTVRVLAAINNIFNPNILFSGTELLIGSEIPDPEKLKHTWLETAKNCKTLNSLQIHEIYYIGSFRWEALGTRAIPYLLEFLKHPCDTVRYYAVLSLGRLARNRQVVRALKSMQKDKPEIVDLAKLALKKIELVAKRRRRVHLTIADTFLAEKPFLDAPAVEIPRGRRLSS